MHRRRRADRASGLVHQYLDGKGTAGRLDVGESRAGVRAKGQGGDVGLCFQGGASQKAEADVSTVTRGPKAGTRFPDVQPAGGTLSVQVLVDKAGSPVSATAAVHFKARATGTGGSSQLVTSKGHYFMHILEGGWTIFGYSVARADKRVSTGP